MKHLYSCILLAALTLPAAAQQTSKISPRLQLQLSQTRNARSAADTAVSAFLRVNSDDVVDELKKMGVSVRLHVGNILTVRIPADKLAEVAALPGVTYIEGASAATAQLDKAIPEAHVDLIHSGKDLPQAYTGKGTVFGVVDAGFDYRQPAYCDANGTTRIRRVWEQSYDKGTAPAAFNYGTELTTPEQFEEAEGDVTTSSHGSHVVGIAAGRDCGNGWGGVAPEADIVLVSKKNATTDNVSIAEGVAYAFEYAKANNKPCVVNLSLGTPIGPHDGTSTFDALTDAIQGEGRIIVGSAGNFGADPIHVATTDGSPISTLVAYKSSLSTLDYGGEIDVWGTKDQAFKVQLRIVKVSTGQVVDQSPLIDALTTATTDTYTITTRNAKGAVTVVTEVNPLNSRPHAYISLALTSMRVGYGLALYIEPASADSKVHAWADDSYVQFNSEDNEGFTKGNTDCTVAEIGGTGKRIITVGAYTTRTSYSPQGSSSVTLDETLGAPSSFSAAGPLPDGRLKPDVCAPGCVLISCLNGNSTSLTSEAIAGYLEQNGHTSYWGYMQGTSMASPFMAGTVALWLEANPNLTPEQLRDVLDHSCTKGVNPTDTAHWGRGKLDAWEGLKYILETQGIQAPLSSSAAPFSMKVNGEGNLELLFAASGVHSPLRVYNTSGMLVRQLSVPESQSALTLPTSSLPHGTYILQVDGKNVKFSR